MIQKEQNIMQISSVTINSITVAHVDVCCNSTSVSWLVNVTGSRIVPMAKLPSFDCELRSWSFCPSRLTTMLAIVTGSLGDDEPLFDLKWKLNANNSFYTSLYTHAHT